MTCVFPQIEARMKHDDDDDDDGDDDDEEEEEDDGVRIFVCMCQLFSARGNFCLACRPA
jgi:hypothetical protein